MNKIRCVTTPDVRFSTFLTDLGWIGLYGCDKQVAGLTIGHPDDVEVRRAVQRRAKRDHLNCADDDQDWFPELRRRLEAYSRGEPQDFRDVEVLYGKLTQFQKRVIAKTRLIPYGQTMTYGRLAERAGAPRAARAVGSVMAANRFPIIIPCHRVVASGGKLGGFSAPQGTDLKELMLKLERNTRGNSK